MPPPKPQRCPCCTHRALLPRARPGRTVRYKSTLLTLPVDYPVPTCKRCFHESLTPETLPPALLESWYRDTLRERVQIQIARLPPSRSQRAYERLCHLSQGYLCRLAAGDGVPSAPLVSLLMLLAEHPELVDELEAYWRMPPTG